MMTARELAKETKVSKSTIYRMARNGEIPCYRIGKAVRFKLKDVEAAIRSQTERQRKENTE